MILISWLLLVSPVLGIPTIQKVLSTSGDKRQDGYIVQFKSGTNQTQAMAWFQSTYGPSGAVVDYTYPPQVLNGFSGRFNRKTAEALSERDDVEVVSEDPIYTSDPLHRLEVAVEHPFETAKKALTSFKLKWQSHKGVTSSQSGGANSVASVAAQLLGRRDPRWNLYDISHKEMAPMHGPYEYNENPSAGQGVNVYVLDTGIYLDHSEFEGRASWGTSFVSETTDNNGHGTHVAANIAGKTYGVAPKSSVIAVQVLNGSGQGAISGIIAAVGWVVQRHVSDGKPSVINLSLKGNPSVLLDAAVKGATAMGVHVCAAAGNSADDASQYSPGRVPEILTVGASDANDSQASFSSFGPVVDIFAPGVNITSAWIGSNTATHVLSGTSQATPHVAGTVAVVISTYGQKSAADMSTTLKQLAKHSVSGLPILQVPLA